VNAVLKNVWRVGSICSGTDCPILVWYAISEALALKLDVTLTIICSFSAECEVEKQNFLRVMLKPRVLFLDAGGILGKTAPSCAGNSIEEVEVPNDFNHNTAGFPCTDASSLNKYNFENRDCITAVSERTGQVFHDIVGMTFVHGHKLLFQTLENVFPLLFEPTAKGSPGIPIGPSNADVIVYVLQTVLDSHVVVYKLDPRIWGAPQTRRRIYFTSVPNKVLEQINLCAEVFDDQLQCLMNRLGGSQITPLSDFLLDDDDPRVKLPLATALSRRLSSELVDDQSITLMTGQLPQDRQKRKPEGSTAKKAAKWPKLHFESMQKIGMNWGDVHLPGPETLHAFPGLAMLSDRQLESLAVEYGGEIKPDTEERIFEVSQQILRHKPGDITDALTPKGIKFLTKRMRPLLGIEGLWIQGIYYPCPELLAKFPDDLLRNMAGNAYDAHSYAGMVFAVLVVLAVAWGAKFDADAKTESSSDEGCIAELWNVQDD